MFQKWDGFRNLAHQQEGPAGIVRTAGDPFGAAYVCPRECTQRPRLACRFGNERVARPGVAEPHCPGYAMLALEISTNGTESDLRHVAIAVAADDDGRQRE